MHVELLFVGAHNGRKMQQGIRAAAAHGPVILVEPVPYLFAELREFYASAPNITCLNCCLASHRGKVRFYAPTPQASQVLPWGDQLGSMNAFHAVSHHADLKGHIVEIEAEAVTFADLIRDFGISSLGTLGTDTEGYDAALLLDFPFGRLQPAHILFEYKHSDGPFNIGRTLGRLLIALDEAGYDMQIIDVENCAAKRRTRNLADQPIFAAKDP